MLKEAASAATPIMILKAGKDLFVLASGHEDFCANARNCQIQSFPDAKHEIPQESDSTRDNALQTTVSIFNEN